MNTPTLQAELAHAAPAFSLDHLESDDLAAAQHRLSEQLGKLIEELSATLERDHAAGDANPGMDGTAPNDLPTGVASLQSAARWREGQARQRRLLAQDMVFSALRNLDNADWHAHATDHPEAAGDGAFLQAMLAWTAPD